MARHREYYYKGRNDETGHKEVEDPPKHLWRTPETIVGKGVVHIATESEWLLLLISGQFIEIGLVVGYELLIILEKYTVIIVLKYTTRKRIL